MKLNGKMLVAVAMLLGSLGSVGCAAVGNKDVSQPANQEEAAAAPVAADAAPVAQQNVVVSKSTVPLPMPPAVRVENPGPAPRANDVWTKGFWRYDMGATQYVWVPGYWQDNSVTVSFAPPAPRYEDPGCAPSADFVFVPGFYRFDGRQYIWVNGHWDARQGRDGYVAARWESVNGRYQMVPGHFTGRDGRDGRDGRNGRDGRDGRDGATAQQGQDGHGHHGDDGKGAQAPSKGNHDQGNKPVAQGPAKDGNGDHGKGADKPAPQPQHKAVAVDQVKLPEARPVDAKKTAEVVVKQPEKKPITGKPVDKPAAPAARLGIAPANKPDASHAAQLVRISQASKLPVVPRKA